MIKPGPGFADYEFVNSIYLLIKEMRKMKYLIFLGLFFNAANSYSGDFKVVERENCNEIQLAPDNKDLYWNMGTSGGAYKASGHEFRLLNKSTFDRVRWGDKTINLHLMGQSVVPRALGKDQSFSLEFQSLYSKLDGNNNTYGRFLGLTETGTRIPDSSARHGFREKILLAILYLSSDAPRKDYKNCHYVSEDLSPNQFENEECLWVDHNTKMKNGKPLCW
jgi:hypothetical protein